jgi:hypothetical protein
MTPSVVVAMVIARPVAVLFLVFHPSVLSRRRPWPPSLGGRVIGYTLTSVTNSSASNGRFRNFSAKMGLK